MNYFLLKIILFSLILSTVLNMALIFCLFKYIRLLSAEKQDAPPLTLPVGHIVKGFDAQMIASKKVTSIGGKPSVLIFLSEKCVLCRSKVPQLELLLPAVDKVDVSFLIMLVDNISGEDNFLSDSPLIDRVISIDEDLIQRLNPRTASPFYLLINHDNELQASGMIGDENWNSFIEQMETILEKTDTENYE